MKRESPNSEERRETVATRALLAVIMSAVPVGLYLGGALALSNLDRSSWGDVLCWDPWAGSEASLGRGAARLAMAAGAVLFLFASPWLLGTLLLRGFARARETPHVWSLVLNSAALVGVCLVLRHTAGLERGAFCAGWLAWTGALAAAAALWGRPAQDIADLWRRRRWDLALVVAAGAAGIAIFWPEHFRQCFNGDGIESYELAASLRTHFLPNWQIETTGEFGPVIVNPALLNSYWTFALQLLLGDGEFATRLPYWVYWVGIVQVCGSLTSQATGIRRTVPLLVLALSTVWYTFYVGYDPYMADLANPGVPDALFTLFLVLSLDSLRRGDAAAWAACMVCASLVLYAGPVLFVLTATAGLIWPPMERWRMLQAALAGAMGLVLIAGSYAAWGWHLGVLDDWRSALESEYVREYFAPLPRWQSGALFAGYFVLGCGGLPTWGVVRAWSGSAWERCAAAVVLAYLGIILGAAVKNLHYLGPLIPVATVLWSLRPARRGMHGGLANCAALVTVAICLVVSWPRERPVFTLTRELGTRTTFQSATYAETCRLAELAVIYDLQAVSWEVGPHTWVYYSERNLRPTGERPWLVTDSAEAPEGYSIAVQSPFGIWLYLRDREALAWGSSERPLIGPARAPAIFQPIAIRPRHRLIYRSRN